MKIKNHSHNCLMISIIVIVAALVMSLFDFGVSLGPDFAGSLIFRYDMGQPVEQDDVKDVLAAQGVTGYSIALSGENGSVLQIRMPQREDKRRVQDLQTTLEDSLRSKYPQMDTTAHNPGYAGPTASGAPVRNALFAVLLAAALMLIYIAIRFGIHSGIVSVFGLTHDVLITLSFMVLLRGLIQVNSSFIGAMMIVAGFSVNNTVVIFDYIRKNRAKPAFAHMPLEEAVSLSLKDSLGRTIGAAVAVLLIICSLCILGVVSIRQFFLPAIIGMVSSFYSTYMINGYVWAFLEGRRKAHQKGKGKQKPRKA